MAFVAGLIGPARYLARDRFARADLATAARLAVIVESDHPDMHPPTPAARRRRCANCASSARPPRRRLESRNLRRPPIDSDGLNQQCLCAHVRDIAVVPPRNRAPEITPKGARAF
jgi:hypothetical protein